MESKRVVILGGGISGLSLAYFLKYSTPRAQVTVVEKKNRPGGKFGTDISTGFVFERGPCLFKAAGHNAMAQLFQMLELDKKAVVAEPPYLNRFFSWKGKIKKLSLFSWDIWALYFKERRAEPKLQDESVYDFAARRFSPEIAEKYFAPMVCGYNGADLKKLSMDSYLPELKEAERHYGSILSIYLRHCLMRKKSHWNENKWLYFPQGSQTVIQALSEALSANILKDREATGIQYKDGVFKVETPEGVLEADVLCSALPAPVIGNLWIPELLSVPHGNITSVCLGYRKKVLPKNGFGYFFPLGNEEGAVVARFDSQVLASQNQLEKESRLTVMLKRNDLNKEKLSNLP